MSNTKTTRPGRSNSLQRMLELEKQAMNLRLNVPQAQPSPSSIHTQDHLDFAMAAKQNSRPSTASHPSAENGKQIHGAPKSSRLPPLVINFGHPRLSIDDTPGASTPSRSMDTPFVTFISDKPSPKVVAFQFPPDVEDIRSVCQSPTWEAYGRAKREKEDKREKREEKREKSRERKEERRSHEQAARNAAPEKKRRLSKPPPSSQHALNQIYGPAPHSPASQKQRPRSASALGLGLPDDLEPPPRTPRARTGSFTSLLRSFDVRRPSVDHNKRDSGFIGGIKLEQERHDAQEKEANTHPALRKSRANSRASSPMRSPASVSTDTEDAKRRAYPPITRQPQANKRRSSSFSQLTRPELGAIDKLRAFIGGKSQPKEEAVEIPTAPVVQPAVVPRVANSRQANRPERIAAPHDAFKPLPAAPTTPRAVPNHRMPSNDDALPIVEPLRLRNKTTPEKAGNNRPGPKPTQTQDGVRSQEIVPKAAQGVPADTEKRPKSSNNRDGARLAVPPEPPRRSSKRKSMGKLDRSGAKLATVNLQTVSDSQSEEPSSPEDYFDAFNRPYTPPELDLSMLGKKPSASSMLKPDSVPILPRPHLSASDDSYSEASRYSTDLSTPNTCRPQSEKGLSPVPPTVEKLPNPHDLANSKPRPSTSQRFDSPSTSGTSVHRQLIRDLNLEDDLDLERIQAAAKKVLAAFPEGSAPRSSTDLKAQSQATTPVGIIPKLKQQAWKSREKIKTGQIPTPPESETDDPSRYPLPRGASLAKTAPKSSPQLRGNRSRPPVPISMPVPKPSSAGASPSFSPHGFPTPPISTHDLPPKPAPASANRPGDQVAKMFVECCSCRYYHDMPSRLYEAMVNPDTVLNATDSGYAGALSMTVKCPWCRHEMSTKCCAGLAAMVHIKERLH